MAADAIVSARRSLRLRGYDYRRAGAYFVTICTWKRRCIFGKVADDEVRLNEIGRIVEQEWLTTPKHRHQVELDSHVIMPNHLHGIIVIADSGRGTARRAPTRELFGKPVTCSLPTIVRAFKSAATRAINESRYTPGESVWQRNYYEHVIRDEDELARARQYILVNPLKWLLDRENPEYRGGSKVGR